MGTLHQCLVHSPQDLQPRSKMKSVNLNGTWYKLCDNWADVDADKLLAIYNRRDEKGVPIPVTSKMELEALSDIPASFLNRCDDLDLFPLYTVISFIHEAELMPYIEAAPVYERSYRRFEAAKKQLQEGKPYKRVIAVAKVFYPNEKKTVQLLGLGLSLVQQIALFLENYADMIHHKPEKNAVEAGVEELSNFSYWGVAFTLAGRDVLKVDAILDKPAIEIYTALYYSFKESQYNKRKFELDHPPKPGKR
jgi:hypothetical protein